MSSFVTYKGFTGTVELEDKVFCGKVIGISDALVLYEGNTYDEFISDFKGAVDDYIALCEEKNLPVKKSYKGSFNVRVSPEVHRDSAIYAKSHEVSLNSFVEQAIKKALADKILG